MKILHLTLKKKWYDMILSGEKKEEYREIKPYWVKRFTNQATKDLIQPDMIVFVNGYGFDKPSFQVNCIDFIADFSQHPEWGGETEKMQFIFKLGTEITILHNPEPVIVKNTQDKFIYCKNCGIETDFDIEDCLCNSCS